MMQYSPIVIGPWADASFARGWMTVFAPIFMGKVPVSEAASAITIEEASIVGGFATASEVRGFGGILFAVEREVGI